MNLEDPIEMTLNELIRDYWHTLVAAALFAAGYLQLKFDSKQLRKDHDAHCKKAEEDMGNMKTELGLRMTTLETNQDKMLELIYREQKSQSAEINSLLTLVHDVRASAMKTEGYLQAHKEFASKD